MTNPRAPKHPIAADTKYWFGDELQQIAIRHDVGGPDITLVNLELYQKNVAMELHQCALAAHATGDVHFNLNELSGLCGLAAEELIRLRQIRRAHSRGTLPTATMKQLPVYQAFPRYLDEDPGLIREGLLAALAGESQSKKPATPPPPLPKSGTKENVKVSDPANSLSVRTEQWLEIQVLAFAISEDMQGHILTGVADSDYITKVAPCFRNNIQRALSIGELSIPEAEIDLLCRHAAAKALKLRRLKASFAEGKISLGELERMPEYRSYREYLEQSPTMAFLALQAAIFQETLLQQKSAKTN